MHQASLSLFDPPQLPALCPKCRRVSGEVRVAATVLHTPNVIRLTVRCKPCGHEWLIDKETEAPLLLSRVQAVFENPINRQ